MKYRGKLEFLGGVFSSFFGSILFTSLKIINRKRKISKGVISIFIFLVFLTGFAQETYNLEIIWQKASPESVFYFGRCIASGDVNGDSFSDIMIVGDSVLHSANPDSFYRGECWIYFGGHNLDTIPDIRISNLQKLTFWSLHCADINGDGFDDVILGACNNGETGQILVFQGGNPMDTICDYKMNGPSRGSVFGCSISSGDVNGDGYQDLIVGAYGAAPRPGGVDMGRVYIYYGGPNFDTVPDVILNGGHENDHEAFGTTVSGSGDVNNDGISDIIIGAMNFNWARGRIYIYIGGNPLDTIYDVAMTGEEPYQSIGESDVDFLRNRTGYDYAVTGTPLFGQGSGGYNQGKVYVLFGGPDMDSIPDVWMIGSTDSSFLGVSSRSAGDLNGDSYDELGSGAPVEYNYRGTAYIWLGGPLLDTTPDAWIRGAQYDLGIGEEVASAGDVDGDRKDEFMACNSASIYPTKVWVCKYTEQGIEERKMQNAERLTLEVIPNPANSAVRVRCPVIVKDIKIYDITGKLVKTLSAENKMGKAENNEIRWDLRDDIQKRVTNGIYFLKLETEKERTINKIIVVK
jgi:hypothetical protein